MGMLTGLFRSRDKPKNRTVGSGYSFFFGGTTSEKAVTEILAGFDLICDFVYDNFTVI